MNEINPAALRELAEGDMFSMTEVYVALNRAADTIDTLRAEVEALRADAERYRFIFVTCEVWLGATVIGDEETLDAIMKEQP